MIGILHLSDIHLVVGTNAVSSRILQIKGAVQSESHDLTELLLVISGDVAFSGKQAEYSIAIDLISELEKALRSITGLTFLGTVVIPGNHDLDFDNEGTVRPALLTTINEIVGTLDSSSDVVEQMTKVQSEFFAFRTLISPDQRSVSRLIWVQEFSLREGKLLVRCFNTAWISRKKEIAGQILFPTQDATIGVDTDAVLVLSVFHHPYGWFNPENGRAFRRMIETSSDVVLTGHEHDGEFFTRSSASGAAVNYVEGAALQATGVPTGFNLVKVDLGGGLYYTRQFEWQKDMFVRGASNTALFTRNQALLEHQFVNNKDYKNYLDDIGAPFTHPIKVQLSLSDLFVYPDLKITTMTPKAGPETVVMSTEILDYIVSKKLVSIAGSPTSGKTSFAKMLYADLQQRKKLVPLLLTERDIRGSDISQVHAAIERTFERQYSKKMLERFMQLEPEAKVAIVDDWHKLKPNAKGKAQVLSALQKHFGRVVVFTDDAALLNQVSEALASGGLAGFNYCEIKQCGYRLRGELVTKWETLGREFETEELEASQRISAGEYLLETLIGKGIVPSFPFFIFSALQIEASTNQPATYGSYGHIYQALLTTRMSRVNPKNLNLKFAFLSLVAVKILDSGHHKINLTELKAVHKRYESEYGTLVDFGKLLEELEEGQVLSVVGDDAYFKHKYAYYYFVAQYFHDAISDVKEAAAIRVRLTAMADSAYQDDNAHILIFYLYMSKDRMLMEHILKNAEKVFASIGMSDLAADVEFANALYATTTKLEAPSEDTDENRRQYRLQRDAAADSQDGEDSNSSLSESEVRDLDFAIQSLNIMGQVLRNFPTDLKVDLKINLTRASYHLGLRVLRSFLLLLRTNVHAFRAEIFKYLKMFQPFSRKRDEEIEVVVDQMFRQLVEVGIFGVLKRISMSMGAQELRETYGAVRSEAGEANIPIRLIDLVIKLDHFARIPEQDVEDLKKRLRGNPTVYTVLRLLVAEFLYLFPVGYKVRQRMTKLLDFQPGAATLSAEKKVKQLSGKTEDHLR